MALSAPLEKAALFYAHTLRKLKLHRLLKKADAYDIMKP